MDHTHLSSAVYGSSPRKTDGIRGGFNAEAFFNQMLGESGSAEFVGTHYVANRGLEAHTVSGLELEPVSGGSGLKLGVSGEVVADSANSVSSSWSRLSDLKVTSSLRLHREYDSVLAVPIDPPSNVSDMLLSKDETTLFSVSSDSSLKVYDLAKKKQIRSMKVSQLSLSSCALSPDEKSLFIGSWDNKMCVVHSVVVILTEATLIRLHTVVFLIPCTPTMMQSLLSKWWTTRC